MREFYGTLILSTLLFLVAVTPAAAQITISGKVSDESTGQGLAGVNIVVQGRIVGTTTNANGDFKLQVDGATPVKLDVSFIGYRTEQITITEAMTVGLDIKLEVETILGQEIVISASRTEEAILQSPVSIERVDALGVQNTASENYYRGLINLKGLDMTQSSVNFQIINARGFNSTGNTRFVQLTDGMDTQAPALNFPIGNLNGPSELDVESVEFIPGAASALYGPNAFNGMLLVNGKNPFEYQGLSAFAKFGLNHIGDSNLNSEGAGKIGPGSPQPMWEGALRYAKAFNNRFAFKVALSYSKALDWYGTNMQDKNAGVNAGYSVNPGADRVHAFGDEVATNIGLLAVTPLFQTLIKAGGLGAYLGDMPNDIVSRTPYQEQYLADYHAHNFKANIGLNYRINDKVELLYVLNYGAGTSVYTGAQRFSLKDFSIQQHKVELKGDNFFLRGYTTIENSGDSYIADLTGILVNRAWKSDTEWFGEYAAMYLGYLKATGVAPGTATAAQRDAAHIAGRIVADNGRFLPGTKEFEDAKMKARSAVIPGGSLFDDKTSLYHFEGQYNFRNQIDFIDLIAGASYRLYDLNSNGTIFADTAGNHITIQEVGAYAQAAKKIFADRFKLTASLRYDKNENFRGLVNPRIAGVYSPAPNHNFRASFQSGFRNPPTQGQHINLDILSSRLLGGLPEYAKAYNIFENAYTVASVNRYASIVAQKAGKGAYAGPNAGLAIADPQALQQLVPITNAAAVRPEQVRTVEAGYKGLVADNFLIDVSYYRNSYDHFITQAILRQAAGPLDLTATEPTEQNVRNAQTLIIPGTDESGHQNTYAVYTNLDEKISAQGAAVGLEYGLPHGFSAGANYNWNKLNKELGDGYLSEFNTPEHKFNITLANRKLTENTGFNIAYRWQQGFWWESGFARGYVPSVATIDAQVSYKVKHLKSIFKVGGSDLLNTRYVLNYGGPTLGAIYYMSITFDQLMN